MATFSQSPNRLLESNAWLELMTLKTNAGVYGVRFFLDSVLLTQMQQARMRKEQWQFPPLNHEQNFPSDLSLGFSVCTYYSEKDAEAIPVIRTWISFDGEIVHQVCRKYLTQPTLALEITSTHYWLTEQFIRQVSFEQKILIDIRLLAWGLSSIIVAISVIVNWQHFRQLHPLLWLTPILVIGLLQIGIRRALRLVLPSLRQGVLRQLARGGLSRYPKTQLKLSQIMGRLDFRETV